MYKYILLFLFSCTQTIEQAQLINPIQVLEKAEYVVLNRPEYPDDYHQIQYIGNWVHMHNLQPDLTIQTGSFAKTNQDTARYEFWGYGVRVRTELSENQEGFKVFIDDIYMGRVNVKNPINTANNLTYSYMDLKPLKPNDHNHVVELVPDGGYFVLNTLTIHYYVDPTPEDPISSPCDSTAINYIDSIRWNIRDSIVYVEKIRWVERDTTIFNFKDSIVFNWIDKIRWVEKDSLILHYDTLGSRIDTVFILPKKITFELN